MSDEFDFNDSHKDSFVRAKSQELPKKQPPQSTPKAKPQSPPEKVDDLVPEKVGQVVDNVFGKLDNLVNDAADYLFGNKSKPSDLIPQNKKADLPPLNTKAPPVPEFKAAPQAPVAPAPAPAPTPKKAAPAKPQITQLSTLQGSRKPEMIRPEMPVAKTKVEGPVITRTTAISELDLPLEILDDQDLTRYFDQMKLYENQAISGGLCNLSHYETTALLKKGYWKHKFNVFFEDLKKLEPGIYPLEMAKSRFSGMRPVYKAQAWRFSSKEQLIKAIEEDINAYLAGKEGKHFHKFIYQVVTARI